MQLQARDRARLQRYQEPGKRCGADSPSQPPGATFVLDFQPPSCDVMNSYCVKPPRLSGQPQQTDAGRVWVPAAIHYPGYLELITSVSLGLSFIEYTAENAKVLPSAKAPVRLT